MRKESFKFSLPVFIFRESKSFIAYCPVLDLSTSAGNIKEAKGRLNEAANLFFEELVEEGRLDEVLGDLGWIKAKNQWNPPTLIESALEKMMIMHK